MNDATLTGNTFLVTGAAGDLGRAAALALSVRGASLILSDLPSQQAGLDETRALATTEGSLGHITATFDVTDRDQVELGLAQAVERAGAIHGVFNNAGYQGQFATLDDVEIVDFRRVLDVNVTGVFNVMQAAARLMTEPGAIVNTASMAGVAGAPNMAAYSASKAAVIALTKTAAKDFAPREIRVNAISPAFIGPGAMWDNQVARQAQVDSPYYGDDVALVAEQMLNQVPLRRYGSPAEVAEVVTFLLSPQSSYLTGINIEIAGGAS